MNHLLRSLAPISDAGWELLDQEARQRVTPALGARKLVDFEGPRGWEHSATNLGRTSGLDGSPVEGVSALRRRVLPLIELRTDFSLSLAELNDADRGADDVDLGPLDRAAHAIATAESRAIFHGWEGAFAGIVEAAPQRVSAAAGVGEYPDRVAGAVELLLGSGVGGGYALAASSHEYHRLIAGEHGGYPLRDHVEKILDGPIVWLPGLEGAVVLSLRGGDFILDVGQDLSVGYASHDGDQVHLYLQESLSFHVATPEAAVPLDG